MKRYKDTLVAILLIFTIVGVLAFTEWVLLKDYEPKPNTGWSKGE